MKGEIMKGTVLLKNMVQKFRFIPILLIFFIVSAINVSTQPQKRIPRPEHPKPQFHRETWLNLNGQWNFGIDLGFSGNEKDWPKDASRLDKKSSFLSARRANYLASEIRTL